MEKDKRPVAPRKFRPLKSPDWVQLTAAADSSPSAPSSTQSNRNPDPELCANIQHEVFVTASPVMELETGWHQHHFNTIFFFFYFYTNLCILYTVRVSSDTPVGIRLWDISSLIWCIVDYVFYHHVIMMTSLAMKLHWWHPKKKVISSQVKSHFTCILWDNCHVYYHNKTAVFVQTKWRDCTLWIVKAQTQDKQTGFMQADGTCPLSNKMYSVIMCHGESD